MSIDTERKKLVTLVGPPNSGKTTLFNTLSGKKHKTVNYPGATIEYSISSFLEQFDIDAQLMDSPGIISLIPVSPDEKVTIDNLYNHPEFGKPDVVVVTVDTSQFSRHLLLARQILDSGFRTIVVLTMNDLLKEKSFEIDEMMLSEILGCDVIKCDPRDVKEIEPLVKLIKDNLESKTVQVHKRDKHTEEDILCIYREIEVLEKKVLKDLNTEHHENPLIAQANKELVIAGRGSSIKMPDSLTMKIDSVLLHKVWGIFIFLSIMALMFTSIFWVASPVMDLVDTGIHNFESFVNMGLGDNWYSDLLAKGIIGGLGVVLVFLPQIVILFFVLGLLEDSGYLARGAMIIDKPLSMLGLNGRSFVPMLSGFACAIPAILAARTIQNKRERYLTIFIIPLMSCSARLPVYGLLLSFLFPGKYFLSGLILSLIYITGVIISLIVAGIINRYKRAILNFEDNSSFIMELPVYRIPKLMNVFKDTYSNAVQYLQKAGPTIVIFSLILWTLTNFPNRTVNDTTDMPKGDPSVQRLIEAERINNSYAANIGKVMEPVMKPLGLDWRVGVSLIATFAAREVFVSSLALIFKVTESDDDNMSRSLINEMKNAKINGTGQNLFTTATAAGLIVFFMLALQCISTIAITKKETGGWRIPVMQIIIYTGAAYLFTFLTVNGLRFFGVN
ncbi:MAG: ferrous iron transport protein B [Bacteroidetes bacterium]|nr:ferrous iron transport protein B [Bacteroidota bacterium]